MSRQMYHESYNTKRVRPTSVKHIREVLNKGGLPELLKKTLNYLSDKFYILLVVFVHLVVRPYFKINGELHKYWIKLSKYSFETNSLLGERVIEISYVYKYVSGKVFDNILEVGCVLNHYYRFKHDIIDKYEIEQGIINQDIVDFFPEEKYDLIISISTIEHIGFDEAVNENGKSQRAILRIRELLKEGGTALITVPLGYNPEVDEMVFRNDSLFNDRIFMNRVSKLNSWEQVTQNEPILKGGKKYGSRNRNTNIAILEIHK